MHFILFLFIQNKNKKSWSHTPISVIEWFDSRSVMLIPETISHFASIEFCYFRPKKHN